MRDRFTFVGFYLAALVLVTCSALATPITSDRLQEFRFYVEAIGNGGAFDFNAGLVASSLLTVWLPAQIHLLTGLDSTVLFVVFPGFFFALLPASVYLLSRRYYDWRGSLIAGGVVMSSFYFAYHSSNGRVSIAWGVLGVLVWALVARRWKTALFFGALLVLSHYSTVYFTAFVLLFACLCMVFGRLRRGVGKRELSIALVVLAVLVGGIYSWYGLVSPSTARIVHGFVRSSFTLESSALDTPKIAVPMTYEEEAELRRVFEESTRLRNFFRLESRHPVTQAVLGMTLPYMNAPQRIEWGLSWAVVLFMSYGLYRVLRYKLFGPLHRWLAFFFYAATVLAVVIPHMGIYYGAVRVYFTGLVVLAPCYVEGASVLSKRVGVPRYILPACVVVFYGLAVSGVLHSWFGVVK